MSEDRRESVFITAEQVLYLARFIPVDLSLSQPSRFYPAYPNSLVPARVIVKMVIYQHVLHIFSKIKFSGSDIDFIVVRIR